MKSLKMLAMFAVVLAVGLFAFDALAASSSNVWDTAVKLLSNTFMNVRVIVYVVGAFGLIGLAIGGIMGAIKWKWLGMLACGLAIIAVADGVVNYALKSAKGTADNASTSEVDFTNYQ